MALKIISWNTNSIRKSTVIESLTKLVEKENPDVICFQETRVKEVYAEKHFYGNELINKFPYRYWNDSINKGHYGVAVWSKIKPSSVVKEIDGIGEGRLLILEFNELTIMNTYVPNTMRGEIAEDIRHTWHNTLICWLTKRLMEKKLLIWCGDLNVVDNPSTRY